MIKFYDTSSLLANIDHIFDGRFVISTITLEELERIKVSQHKDNDIKVLANILTILLDENKDKYEVWIFTEDMLTPIKAKHLTITDDMKILASAYNYDSIKAPDETIFVTNDLSLKNIANLFFGEDMIESIKPEEDSYCGFVEFSLNEDDIANIYSGENGNFLDLLVNEYAAIYDLNSNLVDRIYWNGESYQPIKFCNFKSNWFGDVKPYKDDIYQAFAMDSLVRNKITMIKGCAASGKTYLSLAYLLHKLEKHDIDSIIVFCNPVATANSARLGFYAGTKDEKIMESQIGNILSSKLGGTIALETMVNKEKIVLLPFSDIRGYDTSGMRAGVLITEAQNLDINLMKIAIQRLGEDSFMIIEGDEKAQVDMREYEGLNNGMRRASKVFRGEDIYGEVRLQQVHRSRAAKIAEAM